MKLTHKELLVLISLALVIITIASAVVVETINPDRSAKDTATIVLMFTVMIGMLLVVLAPLVLAAVEYLRPKPVEALNT